MAIKICPRCLERYSIAEHSGDYVHNCAATGASEFLKNEDVVRLQSWTDPDGSSGQMLGPAEFMMQGLQLRNFGEKSRLLGVKTYDYTSRGARKATHRTRGHLEHIPENG